MSFDAQTLTTEWAHDNREPMNAHVGMAITAPMFLDLEYPVPQRNNESAMQAKESIPIDPENKVGQKLRVHLRME